MDLAFHASHKKWFAKTVYETIRDLGLIEPGERVAVGLSGGKDSAALLYVLWYMRHHLRFDVELAAIHVRTVTTYDTSPLREFCGELGVEYLEETLCIDREPDSDRVCSVCARLKRGAAGRLLAARGIGKLAYGHHATDAAVTLLMNLVLHRTVAAFPPLRALEGAPVTIIRPLVRLDEETVAAIARFAGLPVLTFDCPYARANVRTRFRAALEDLARTLGVDDLPVRLVAALENAGGAALWARLAPVGEGAVAFSRRRPAPRGTRPRRPGPDR